MAKDLAAYGTQAATTASVKLTAVLITEQRETNRLLRILAGEAELAESLPVPRKVDVSRPARTKRKWRNDRSPKEVARDFSGFLR